MFSSGIFGLTNLSQNEYQNISIKLAKDENITNLTNYLIQKNINLKLTYNNFNYIEDSNKSVFAGEIISNRLNESNIKGNKGDSLRLLEFILKSGANTNVVQHDGSNYRGSDFFNGNQTLVTMAADACSLDTIKLLQKYGADLSQETFYWTRPLKELKVENSKPCIETANYLAKFNTSNDFYTLWSFLFPKSSGNSFLYGNDIDASIDDQLRTYFKDKLNITFSKKPNSNEPSDDWYNDFQNRLSKPYGQDVDDTDTWWNSQSDDLKAWACYYSTFDEARSGFNKVGYTDDDMTKTAIGGPFIFKYYSNFLVHTFSDYCDSIK